MSINDTLLQQAKVLNAEVMHKRFLPKINAFAYNVYYISLPIDLIDHPTNKNKRVISNKKFSRHSFFAQDHGYRDERPLKQWAHDLLAKYNCPRYEDITLICMPRVFGYVFNPVSFWVCKDEKQQIKAIICEVNNTFGQTHTYVCLPPHTSPLTVDSNDSAATSYLKTSHINSVNNPTSKDPTESSETTIAASTWINAEKCFHVSPFLPREGEYRFRFDINAQTLYINIDYYDKAQNKMLVTSLKGAFLPLTTENLNRAFWRSPLVTLKAIALIHYQALKLFYKKITFYKLPKQLKDKDSRSRP